MLPTQRRDETIEQLWRRLLACTAGAALLLGLLVALVWGLRRLAEAHPHTMVLLVLVLLAVVLGLLILLGLRARREGEGRVSPSWLKRHIDPPTEGR